LDTDVIQRKRQEFLSSSGDPNESFRIIQENYKKRGIEALSQTQVHCFIDYASIITKNDDKQLVTNVVKSFCLDEDRDKVSKRNLIKSFIHLCYGKNDYESAKEIADLAMASNLFSRRTLRIYMTMLYNSGLYDEVFPAYKACDDGFKPKSKEEFANWNLDTTLVMAALYQHGTDEAFRDAMEIKKTNIDRFAQGSSRDKANIAFSRGTALAGWFAVEKGKYGLAVDLLEKFDHKSDLILNILCYAKAKCGDCDGAIKELTKSVQKSAKRWKILLSPQVMDAISQEVKYFDSPMLNENFSNLCTILDRNATLGDQNLRERVLEPLEKGGRKSEFSNYKNSQYSNQESAESDDDENYSLR